MRKLIVVCLIALSCFNAAGQSFKIKEHLPSLISFFAAGAFEGTMDHLQFHYDGNHQFWQPDISWKNKYKNRDPQQGLTFAGRYFVTATDGWHLMKGGKNMSTVVALVFHPFRKGQKWYYYVVETASYWAANKAGFHLTYNLILK